MKSPAHLTEPRNHSLGERKWEAMELKNGRGGWE